MPTDISGRLSAFDGLSPRPGISSHAPGFSSYVSAGGVVVAVVFRAGQTQHLEVDHQHADDDCHVPVGGLLQNTQKWVDDAVQHKLYIIADGLADLMAIDARA
jgi:hypothetical protein